MCITFLIHSLVFAVILAVFIPAFAQALLSSPRCHDRLSLWSVLLCQRRVAMNMPPVRLS